MAQSVKFWDRIARYYSKRPVTDEAAYQKKLRVTREYLRPDMEVMEFGCGTGSTAFYHAPYVKHINAIDASSKMIEIAKEKANANGVENINFKRSTIEEISLPDESVDAVMGHSILHLLENREEVIAKVYRMLKPGGVFITNTMCMEGTMAFFKIIAPIGNFLGLLPMVKFFTPKDLENSMVEAGFKIDYQWRLDKKKVVFIVAKKIG